MLNRAELNGGVLQECFKCDAGQVTVRTFEPGAASEKHRHNKTNERWWVACGRLEVVLDFGPWATTLELGKGETLALRAGTWHTVRNVGDGLAVLVFWADRVYDPEEPDKELWRR